MNRLILAAFASLALTGCAPGMFAGFAPAAPAPLERTTIDDRGLETAWKVFDVTLDAINLLGDAGVIVPGTARGKAVASGIRKVNTSLAAAERFAAAGSSTEYATALREAQAGIADIRTVLGSK